MKPLLCKLAAILLSLSSWASAAAFTVDGLNYSVKNGYATLLGATSRNITSVSIPATVTYGGTTYPVYIIMHNAFDNYMSLRSVRFEDSDQPIHCPGYTDSNGYVAYSSPFENCPVEEYYWGRDPGAKADGGDLTGRVFMSSTSDNVSVTYAGKTYAIYSNMFDTMSAAKVTALTIGGNISDISSKAFTDCSNLKNVTLLDGSYTLPSGVFPADGNYNLILESTQFTQSPYAKAKHVTFGDNWKEVPKGFFYRSGWSDAYKELISVTLPSELKKIGYDAFRSCPSLTSINFPETLTSIGSHAFYNCEKLIPPVIGNKVETIGWNAFYGCKQFKELTVPASVTSIDESAFSKTGISKLVFEQSNDSIKLHNSAFQDLLLDSVILNRIIPTLGYSKPKHVTFGDCWKEIPKEFFYRSGYTTAYKELISVSLPSALNKIGYDAFHNCSSLTSINFPEALTSIGSDAFYNCTSLIPPVIGNKVKTIGRYAFYGCKQFKELTVPASVTSIDESAFQSTNISKLVFEQSNDSIKLHNYAFQDLLLDSVILNRIIPTLGYSKPKHVTFGDCWKEIPKEFFYRSGYTTAYKELISVSLPSALNKIGYQAFYCCSNLDSIFTAAKTPPTCVGNNVFASSIYPKAVVTVPMGSRRKYAAAEVWKNFANIHTEGALLVTVDYDHALGEVKLNGEVTDSLELDEGEPLDVAVTPAAGYDIASVTANGEDCTGRLDKGVLHYDEISDTLAIAVKFAPIMFDIKLPAAIKGGHIEVNGKADAPAQLQYGSHVELRPVADEGYLLKSMSVNGTAVTLDANGEYIIESLTESITVDAVFEIIRFKASAKYDSAKGSVTLNGQTGETLVDYGTALTIKATPNDGHYVGELKVNGAAVNHEQLSEPVIIGRVTEDVAVEVAFDIYTYAITATYDNALGSVSINGSEGSADVDWGMDAAVIITPAYGYQIATVELDGSDVSEEVDADGRLTIKAVKADHRLTVVFEIKRVSLSIAMEGGAIMTIHDFGSEFHYIPVPEKGWKFHSATVGSEVITSLDKDGSFLVGPLTDDTTVSVVFRRPTSEANALGADAITVTVREHTVMIAGAADDAIAEVYDAAGLRFYSGLKRAITLDKAGVYIVTISGQSFKVMLR